MENVVRFEVPGGDFCEYLKGFWKRNLEWRQFGASFKHLRATNNVVFIEEDMDAARQPNTQCVLASGPSSTVGGLGGWTDRQESSRAGTCAGRSAARTRRRTSRAPTLSRFVAASCLA